MFKALYEKRINNPIILKINPEVIFLKDTLISNVNATRSDAQIGKDYNSFKTLNFDLILSSQIDFEEDNKKYLQAEILIKDHIPIKFIENIFYPDIFSY
jgi:hypothetical protein